MSFRNRSHVKKQYVIILFGWQEAVVSVCLTILISASEPAAAAMPMPMPAVKTIALVNKDPALSFVDRAPEASEDLYSQQQAMD
eukprot:6158202-Amphidinium_carterae.1